MTRNTNPTLAAEPYEALENLARSLASLHAARDFQELAGHLEHLGERCAEALLALMLLADDSGELRLISGSRRRSTATDEVRTQLGVDRITQNPEVIGAVSHVVTARAPQWFDVEDLFAAPGGAAPGCRCVMAPMWIDGEALGVCLFVVPETAISVRLVSILVDHAGVALRRLRELKQARDLHGMHPQLWVSDESLFRDSLTRELSRARRYGGSVGVTAVRIECEAELRARYGDFYTNHLLRRIGGRLASTLRDTDLLGALGGGFAVIYPATTLRGAQIAAERLMDEVGSMLSANYPELELSLIARITAETASSPDHGTTANELIDHLQLTVALGDKHDAAA